MPKCFVGDSECSDIKSYVSLDNETSIAILSHAPS